MNRIGHRIADDTGDWTVIAEGPGPDTWWAVPSPGTATHDQEPYALIWGQVWPLSSQQIRQLATQTEDSLRAARHTPPPTRRDWWPMPTCRQIADLSLGTDHQRVTA